MINPKTITDFVSLPLIEDSLFYDVTARELTADCFSIKCPHYNGSSCESIGDCLGAGNPKTPKLVLPAIEEFNETLINIGINYE